MSELLKHIKKGNANVYRRAFIKRRELSTGLFEDDWVEVTADVKSYGKIKTEIDAVRVNKFNFANGKITFNNEDGKYNPHDDDVSLWYNYLNQQRTLVKIEAGFLVTTDRADGGFVTEYLLSDTLWDRSYWDSVVNTWDLSTPATIFQGIISGDVVLGDNNSVSFNLKPLTSLFQEFPAKNLSGWTSTGMTASQFITMVRDQTDGAGQFIFRPFFNDTTGYWDISTTTNIYSNLNTSTAQDVYNSTVWDIIEKLAEAENYVPYINRAGVFKFVSRSANTTAASFEFHGAGSVDSEYGHTIKSVKSYSRKLSKYYSRISVKYREADTVTSYEIREATFTVSSVSNPWVLGHKTLDIENLYIPTSTVAATIANAIYAEYSDVKNEIDFTSSFIPHLDVLDRISITYDPSEFTYNSLWDQNDWASDATSTTRDLTWDASRGDAIKLTGEEFKFLSMEIDLDNFENRYIAREV